jgi:hypothetical protein
MAIEQFFSTFVWKPVVDGSFITDRPSQLLAQGKINQVLTRPYSRNYIEP